MRLGLNIGYWGLGLTAEDQLELVREAEDAGFDSVWVAEAYGSDAATVLAWLAAQTERIKIGAAIFQMPARSPAMTAMTAATLDQLSDGRMLLGIGSSGPQVAEGWHGQRFGKQLQRTREYVEIVRKALARERLVYEGEQYTLPLPDGPGKALKLTIAPVQERIPIYIAAIGPKNTQLTGEIADGWLPIFFSPEHVDDSRALLEEGARALRASSLDGFDIAPTVNVCIDDDVDRARDEMRHFIALYVGGMGSREQELLQRARAALRLRGRGRGDPGPLPRRQEGRGGRRDARRADRHGHARRPADRVRERLAVYREAGVGTLIVSRRWRSSPSSAGGWSASSRRCSEAGAASCSPPSATRATPFPAIALGRELPARGHDVTLETWAAGASTWSARACASRGARVPGLPHARAAAQALRGGGQGRRPSRAS